MTSRCSAFDVTLVLNISKRGRKEDAHSPTEIGSLMSLGLTTLHRSTEGSFQAWMLSLSSNMTPGEFNRDNPQVMLELN